MSYLTCLLQLRSAAGVVAEDEDQHAREEKQDEEADGGRDWEGVAGGTRGKCAVLASKRR